MHIFLLFSAILISVYCVPIIDESKATILSYDSKNYENGNYSFRIRKGGGMLFQQLEAAYLKLPRNAAVLCDGIDKMLFAALVFYSTSNGMFREEQGVLVNRGEPNEHFEVRGSYSYLRADGKTQSVEYTADENGFKYSTTTPLDIRVSYEPALVATLLGK